MEFIQFPINITQVKYLKGSIGHVLRIFYQLHSALTFWFVASFKASVARWCDNATVGHPWIIRK